MLLSEGGEEGLFLLQFYKPFEIIESKSALKKFTVVYTIEGQKGYDERSFLNAVKQTVIALLRGYYETKVKIILHCIMERYEVRSGEIITANPAIHSNVMINVKGSDTDDLYSEMSQVITEKIAMFKRTASNWNMRSVVNLEVDMLDYKPLKGNSYIELPKALRGKRAIINMRNESDNECFKWAVTRALHPNVKNPQRIDKALRERASNFNWNGIEFPVSLASINKFEKQNETISVNVLGYKERCGVYPLRISDYDRLNKVNLLLIAQDEISIIV